MSTFVTLYNYTGAIEGGGPERLAKVEQIVAEEDGKILQIFGLLGAYDVVSISEFPDNQGAMKAAARVGNLIGANTHTMPAVEQEAFIQMLSEL